MKRTYQVKEVAQLAGVSVRTLHHYDELGLLAPTARTTAGYRLYDDDDLLQAAIYVDAVAAMAAGTPPDAPAALAIAERHRLSIDRWFYPCSMERHRGLADMYEADARFAANIDKYGAGLTPYLAAAIRANAARRAQASLPP